jgi:hypothetical protein
MSDDSFCIWPRMAFRSAASSFSQDNAYEVSFFTQPITATLTLLWKQFHVKERPGQEKNLSIDQ